MINLDNINKRKNVEALKNNDNNNNIEYKLTEQSKDNGIMIYLNVVAWLYFFIAVIIGIFYLFAGGPEFGIPLILSGILVNALFLGVSEIIVLLSKRN